MKPNIELEIEELVLQGFPPGDRYRIGAAVQSELLRLLTDSGLASSLQSGGALPSVRAEPLQLTPTGSPNAWGQQIAQAVYGGLGPKPPSSGNA